MYVTRDTIHTIISLLQFSDYLMFFLRRRRCRCRRRRHAPLVFLLLLIFLYCSILGSITLEDSSQFVRNFYCIRCGCHDALDLFIEQ